MTDRYQDWLDRVRDCLDAIGMSEEHWQSKYLFDFEAEYNRGAAPEQAAMNANKFWRDERNKAADQH